jgi:EAL domain-containing protein (putative c-di-GMP-specific phosphodiesterase class I)
MRARVIAEGIEREEECATLLALGIELGQGFLFHREASA